MAIIFKPSYLFDPSLVPPSFEGRRDPRPRYFQSKPLTGDMGPQHEDIGIQMASRLCIAV